MFQKNTQIRIRIYPNKDNSIRKYLGHIPRIYLRYRTRTHGKMWGIIFHGYQDMSQGKGNISVRCQMRGKIYKRPIQRGANAKIRHTHIQRLNSEKYVQICEILCKCLGRVLQKVDSCNNLHTKFTI